jgi:hypothetical protein
MDSRKGNVVVRRAGKGGGREHTSHGDHEGGGDGDRVNVPVMIPAWHQLFSRLLVHVVLDHEPVYAAGCMRSVRIREHRRI